MKRILLLVGIGCTLLAAAIFGAAPAANTDIEKLGDTLTVDSQFTGAWELLDSVIVAKTDTCFTVYTIEGHAELDPDDILYVGFIDGGGAPGARNDTLIVDTFIFYPDHGQTSKSVVAFKAMYIDSLISQSATADTIYYMAAVKGSAGSQKVLLLDVFRTATVLDH